MKSRHTLAFIVGVGLSALFLWLALREADLTQMRASLERARLFWAVPLLALLAGFCVTKAWRWAMLLDLPRSGVMPLTRAVLVGYAATSLLPLQLGELVRAWAGVRTVQQPAAAVLVSIAMERIFDLLAVLLVLSVVLLAGGALPGGLLSAAYVMAAGAVTLLLCVGLYVARTEQCLRIVERFTQRLSPGLRGKILAQLRAGAAGAVALKRPGNWLPIFFASIAQWALMCGCIAASCIALGVQVPASAYAAVLGLTIVGMSLPSGPGYIGSIQLAFALGLAPFGVAAADAVAASLFYHLLVCGSLTIAGVACLYKLGGRVGSIPQLKTSA